METTEPQTLEQMAEGLLITEDTEAPVEEQTEGEAEEVEADEADEATEQEAEDAEGEDEPEAEEDEDESEQEADEAPQTFSVKVDGKETEVTLDELRRGYAGQAYIQKGMSEAADTQKRAEAELTALSQERQHLAQLAQTLQTTGLKLPVAPSRELAQNDPIGYIEAKAQFDDDMAQYNQTMAGIQQQQQQTQQAEQKAREAYANQQRELLNKVLPDMTDPEKGPVLQKKLVATGTEYGFADNEIAMITDARMVQVLHDAMRYRETMAKKEQVTQKAAKARPVAKPSAKKAKPSAAKQTAELRKRARQGDAEAELALMFDPNNGA